MRATSWVWHREKANIKTLLIQGKGNLWSSENHRNSSYTASIARTVLSLAFETASTQLQGAGLPFAFADRHIKQNDLGLDKPCWDGFGWFLTAHIIWGWSKLQFFFLGDYYFLPPTANLSQSKFWMLANCSLASRCNSYHDSSLWWPLPVISCSYSWWYYQ